MTPVARKTRALVLVLLIACAAVVAGSLAREHQPAEPRGEVVPGSRAHAWKTVEYRGVRVDVPASWTRQQMRGCEFPHERWAPPGSPDCEYESGLAFYGAALFDPSRGPGVSRTSENGAPAWGGYVYAGDFAVYATAADRAVVERVLDSAREVR